MNTHDDYEARNLSYLLDGHEIELTEKLWCKHFELTEKGPFSIEPECHQLLRAAYQRIKILEKKIAIHNNSVM